jgi:hypothetical protein
MKTLAVLQPGYLPWIGFFDQMLRCDVFVVYDDVQYDKHGWRNRNRIKALDGPRWLTVPVRTRGLQKPTILDVEIDNTHPWVRKHIGSLKQFYSKASFLDFYLPRLEEHLNRPWNLLIDLNLAIVSVLAAWLDIERTLVRSSALKIKGEQSERLLNLCLHFGAERYLSGDAAKSYLDGDLFARHGIQVEWQNYRHPIYPQQHGAFVSHLSVIDLLLNCGSESADIIRSAKKDV